MKQENIFTHDSEVSTDILVKKNIYDSVFTHLFRQPEYTLQLYQALHPEDTEMTEDQLQIVTLENLLLKPPSKFASKSSTTAPRETLSINM